MNFLNSFSNFTNKIIRGISSLLNWKQLGVDINGRSQFDQFGTVSLNAAGNRLAVASPLSNGVYSSGNDKGSLRVFELNGTSWDQLGLDIDGESADDQSGYSDARSISLNAAGDRIAIGALFNDGTSGSTTDNRGHVRVYSWNGSAWTQLGADIDGEAAGDQSGISVSMNSIGDRLAIGANLNDGTSGSTTDNRGHVRIYSWNGTAWIQLGADIDGEAANDRNGSSVSLNGLGDRVAIGAPFNSSYRGHARIYSWNGTAWIQLGEDIDGEAGVDNSGYSVSLNEVGDRIAIGAWQNDGNGLNSGHVRIYSWNGTAWTQIGSDINGEAANNHSSWSVSINARGDMIAIGAPQNDGTSGSTTDNRGHVRIYQWDGVAWTQIGSDIDGESNTEQSGYSVSINAAGDKVAIGSPFNFYTSNTPGQNFGQVRVYSLQDLRPKAWIQIGSDIDGEADGDQSGYSVSLNAAGNIVAIGAPYNDGTGTDAGHVRVYSWNGSAWTQLGSDINGVTFSDNNGFSVSLNAVGDRLAIGMPSNDGSGAGSNIGVVKIYQWNGTAWTQMGSNILGEAANDESGYSVSLNGLGDRVAIGAPYNDGATTNAGSVRIYRWTGSVWTQMGSDINGENDNFSYSGSSVSINAVGDRVVIGTPSADYSNLSSIGHFRVFSWNGTSWIRMGSVIIGEYNADYSGSSVSISAAGDIVAIGSPSNAGTSIGAGHVRIYRWNGTDWAKMGQDIDGEFEYGRGGYSVSLNAAGDRVAIGIPGSLIYSFNPGIVIVYSWDGSNWIKLGQYIYGEAAHDGSGFYVSMNAIGDRVAIGAIKNDGTGTDAGHVRIYELKT